jgi:hypothetical protein
MARIERGNLSLHSSSGMYMQEVLELVCRKRKLPNTKDYTLLLGDMSLLIPLDRTVASLQGKRELVLVKRSMLPQLGIDVGKVTQKTTDPNGDHLSFSADLGSFALQRPFSNRCRSYQKFNHLL